MNDICETLCLCANLKTDGFENFLFIQYSVMQIQEEQIEMAKIKVEEPKTKVAEVQTVYRESEA